MDEEKSECIDNLSTEKLRKLPDDPLNDATNFYTKNDNDLLVRLSIESQNDALHVRDNSPKSKVQTESDTEFKENDKCLEVINNRSSSEFKVSAQKHDDTVTESNESELVPNTVVETVSIIHDNDASKECSDSLLQALPIMYLPETSDSLLKVTKDLVVTTATTCRDVDGNLSEEKKIFSANSPLNASLLKRSLPSAEHAMQRDNKVVIKDDDNGAMTKNEESSCNDSLNTALSTSTGTSQESASKVQLLENTVAIAEALSDNTNKLKSTFSIQNDKRSIKSTVRPTLAEDNKLVKILLPTNPVNIMQSNVQFLNKSRNFLNFITEKSTNIMEKTLLPQHLNIRYNSILKLSDTGYATEKKCSEGSCTSTESSTTDLTSGSENDLICRPEIGTDILLDAASVDTKAEFNIEQFKSDSINENQDLFSKCTIKNYNSSDVINRACINGSLHEVPIDKSNRDLEKFIIDKSNQQNPRDNETEQLFAVIAGSDLNGLVSPRTNDDIEIHSNCESNSELRSDPTKTIASQELQTDCSRVFSDDDSGVEGTCREKLIDSTTLKNCLHKHPVYLTLLRDYVGLKDKNQTLLEKLGELKKENQQLETENNKELYAIQFETLEKTINQLRCELRTAMINQEMLSKEYAAANKEKESMVMKYAVSEKQLIDTQRARDYAERKVKESLKEQELLQNKLKQVQGERTRICNILDGKCHEVTDLQKELEKFKEDLNMRDVKLKWTQSKLKSEMEIQKETQQKLDKAMLRINEMREECEQVRQKTQEAIRKFQQSEENKAVTLDQQLKEQQARLILERHVTEDKEMSRLQLQKEVDLLKQRQQVLIEENNTLSLKVQDLEKDRLSYDSNLSNLKIIADQRQKEIVDLVGKVSQLETIKLQLKHKDQCLASNEAEVQRLCHVNEELQADMDSCRQREAHMLDFTQKLTDKNVRLQSEFTMLEAKAEHLELEQGPLRQRINELVAKVKLLEENLSLERNKRTEECEILARHVAEQTQLARNFAQKLEDSQGENAVLKRKQQISLQEMTRELRHCRKRLEILETGSPSNSLDLPSRTGSSTSLNMVTGDTLNGAVSDNSTSGDHVILSAEPDRQTLIDRIVKLQKINVRRAEKLDFLEEHTRTLVEELQKKTKIIQNYILHENFDAMGSNDRDRNKAELARYGGIMASVYNQRVSDDHMTLELSLEINQKLQTVLEDTLLKNITLKDSIDTLGEEIARLTMQSKQRQK